MKGIDAAIEGLQEQQTRINSGNEMRMVSLQSMMQQRTQIISLSTNLLKKLDDANQAIIRNLA